MREITAYQAADGSIHTTEKSSVEKDDDLLGKELDGLLQLFNLDLARSQEYKALVYVMKNRDELLKATHAIVRIIEHGEGE